MTLYDYIMNKSDNPYGVLMKSKKDIINRYNEERKEKEIVDKIVNSAVNRIMLMIDTGQAMGKIKELNDAIESIGK